jgi:hypothetical protein
VQLSRNDMLGAAVTSPKMWNCNLPDSNCLPPTYLFNTPILISDIGWEISCILKFASRFFTLVWLATSYYGVTIAAATYTQRAARRGRPVKGSRGRGKMPAKEGIANTVSVYALKMFNFFLKMFSWFEGVFTYVV